QIICQGLLEGRPRREILLQLQQRVPRLGPWNPQHLAEDIRRLRRPSNNATMLPAVLPAEIEKDQVIDVIAKAIGAGGTWVTIAKQLNGSGFRPPRGEAFTPIGVRQLFMRSKGLTHFRLPTIKPPPPSDS